jgi:hypothetical protein
MDVKIKSGHDPMGEWGFVNAYMRWALLASEEVAGEKGLNIVLRNAGLERYIGNYPPENFEVGGKISDYTALCVELLNFFGRAGRGSLVRIGRRSTQLGLKLQSEQLGLNNLAAASKLLPAGLKLKAGIEAHIAIWTTIYKQVGGHWHARSEDRGDKWAYIVETCTHCVDREADKPICHVWTGALVESIVWQMGKEYDVQETECRALGAPACVWEIAKQPRE